MSRLSSNFFLAAEYVSYYIKSGNEHTIHSPFIFDLYNKAIKGRKISPESNTIERLRKSLLKNSNEITFTDFGAGSQTGKNRVRKISEIASSSAKNTKYASFLYRLCSYLNSKTIIELGTSLGISTGYMASARPQKIYTIEGCEKVSELARENLLKLNFQNIQFMTGTFESVLPELLQTIPSFDLAFIDGNHQYQPTVNYFNTLLEKANDNSCFVFDDINWSAEMKRAWLHICEHKSTTASIDLFFMGIIFINPKLSKQHFILRF